MKLQAGFNREKIQPMIILCFHRFQCIILLTMFISSGKLQKIQYDLDNR